MKTYIIEKTCGAPDWSTVPALEADNHLWIPSENIHMTAQIHHRGLGKAGVGTQYRRRQHRAFDAHGA